MKSLTVLIYVGVCCAHFDTVVCARQQFLGRHFCLFSRLVCCMRDYGG